MLQPIHLGALPTENDPITAAIANATASYPIDPRGLGPFDEPYSPNQHSFDQPGGREQVATALAWLQAEGRHDSSGRGAYGLKYQAERWGKANGLSPYVSTGAMLIALYALGRDVVRYGR